MTRFLLLSTLATLLLSTSECTNKAGNKKYKGKLEIAGICMNYTISVVNGDMDSSLVEADWTDMNGNKSYKNVFALGSPCTFPDTIKQGDEFWFTIDTTGQQSCAVCDAWYPRPAKSIRIKVTENP